VEQKEEIRRLQSVIDRLSAWVQRQSFYDEKYIGNKMVQQIQFLQVQLDKKLGGKLLVRDAVKDKENQMYASPPKFHKWH